MPAPYKRTFMLNDQPLTTVVLDQQDFDNLCEKLKGIIRVQEEGSQRVSEEDIEALKRAKHIPLMTKGSLTQPIYEMFDIQTDYSSFIVRGHGKELLAHINN